MEISLTEMLLFIWAIGATALYLEKKRDAYLVNKMLWVLLENPEEREKIVNAFGKFKAAQRETP
jgi:hypothetical protein